MKAAVIQSINCIEVCDVEKPAIQPDHVLLKIAYGGFCGPTELGIIEGKHPRAKFPLIFCHEFSGIIEETNETSSFQVGEAVTVNPLISCRNCYVCRSGDSYICENLKLIGIDCAGGFAEYCLVPDENLVRIPAGLPLKLAALVEPVAVGIHAVRNSPFKTGDTALVLGAGPIGLITALCLKTAGTGEVLITDLNAARLRFAQSFGLKILTGLDQLRQENKPVIDQIFDTTGSPAVLADAVDLVKIKGFIAIVGKFDEPAPVNLHDVLFKELTIRGFRVYRDEEFAQAVRVIANNQDSFGRLITDLYALDDINQAIADFRNHRNLCKIMVKP